MATNSREARRKRILERGTDRLALITGRIPPSTSSSQQHQLLSVSLPASLYQDRDPQFNFSDQTNVASQAEDDVPSTELPRHETSNGSVRSAAIDSAGRVEPQLRKCETHIDTERAPALDISSEVKPSLVQSTVQEPPNSVVDRPVRHAESWSHHTKLFTANKIRSSIHASENIRILSSVTIALTVVLSHLSIPLISSNTITSIMVTRPVYLVLLTDVTIVLAWLLFRKQVGYEKTEEEIRIPRPKDAYSLAEGLGKALENGLVLYKAICAAFMDCSVYLVVVICGLSLSRFLCNVN